MTSLKQYLDSQKLLDKVAVPTRIAALLNGLQIVEDPAQTAGHVVAGIDTKPLFLDYALKPGGPQLPYTLTTSATGFSLVLDFTQTAGADSLLTLLGAVASNVLVAAQEKSEPSTGTDAGGQPHAPNVWLEPLPPVPPSADPPPAKITKLGVAIVIDGTFGGTATLRISPSPSQPEGLVAVGLDPQTVLLGTTGFGLKLGGDMVLDLSSSAATDVPAVVDGKTLTMPSAVPGWKGLTIHKARFYLPEKAPIFGKTAPSG